MHSVLLIAAGSRGDTEPMLSLATALLRNPNFSSVHLALHPCYLPLVPSTMTAHPLPYDLRDITSIYFSHFLGHLFRSMFSCTPLDTLTPQNKTISSIIRRLSVRSLSFLHSIVQKVKPSIIITGLLNLLPAHTLAQYHHIPLVFLNLHPIIPTSLYPCIMASHSDNLEAALSIDNLMQETSPKTEASKYNISTYETITHGYHVSSLPTLNKFRAQLLMKPLSQKHLTSLFLPSPKDNLQIFNAYHSNLIPPVPNLPTCIQSISPVADQYLPPDWDPNSICPTLCSYLRRRQEKPFCVSFGSMKFPACHRKVSRRILQALREARINSTVILKGQADLGAHRLLSHAAADRSLKEWSKNHVFFASEPTQYAWLFPRISGLMCHGGAGTVMAAITAGTPLLVVPIVCDQFFWGRLVRNLGIGVDVGGGVVRSSSEELVKGMNTLLHSDIKKRVKEMREVIRGRKSGVDEVVSFVERVV